MNWIFIAALAGLASNIFNFLSRYFLKEKDDPTVYAWYFEVIRLIAFCLVAIVDWKVIINIQSIILFILLGLTESLAAYWLMKMHEYSHLSISTILSRTRLIWVPIIGFFLLKEQLHLSEYIGIVVLFIGLSIIVAPHKLFVDKGAMYANLDAFIIALNIVITKMTLPFGSNSVINALMVLPSVFLFPVCMPNAKKRISAMFHQRLLLKTFAIGVNIISVYLFTIALRIGDASKVTAVYQGMMVVAVLAGIVILKEREDVVRKLVGTGVTLGGVYLLNSF